MSSNPHSRFLKVKKDVLELPRNMELRESRASFLRQVIRHLNIDVVGRNQSLASPAFLNDLNQFLGDVEAEAIIPAIIEPLREFLRGIVIKNVNIEFPLSRKPRHCQVAAA